MFWAAKIYNLESLFKFTHLLNLTMGIFSYRLHWRRPQLRWYRRVSGPRFGWNLRGKRRMLQPSGTLRLQVQGRLRRRRSKGVQRYVIFQNMWYPETQGSTDLQLTSLTHLRRGETFFVSYSVWWPTHNVLMSFYVSLLYSKCPSFFRQENMVKLLEYLDFLLQILSFAVSLNLITSEEEHIFL